MSAIIVITGSALQEQELGDHSPKEETNHLLKGNQLPINLMPFGKALLYLCLSPQSCDQWPASKGNETNSKCRAVEKAENLVKNFNKKMKNKTLIKATFPQANKKLAMRSFINT